MTGVKRIVDIYGGTFSSKFQNVNIVKKIKNTIANTVFHRMLNYLISLNNINASETHHYFKNVEMPASSASYLP